MQKTDFEKTIPVMPWRHGEPGVGVSASLLGKTDFLLLCESLSCFCCDFSASDFLFI